MADLAIAIAIAGLLLAGLYSAISPRILAFAPIALVSFVYLANPAYRVFSAHGFYHVSIVYGLMNGDIPPHDPFFAGRPLFYPWVYECLAAVMSWVLGVVPPTSFALLNLIALALAIGLILRIARLLGYDDTSACLAAWLALLGTTPLNVGPVAAFVNPYLPFAVEFRGTPALIVFTHPTGATVAIALFLLALEATIHAVRDEPVPGCALGILLLSLVGTGLIYPLQYLALAAGVMVAGAAAWQRGQGHRRRALGIIATVVAATVFVLPYFWLIGHGRDPGQRLGMVSRLPAALSGVESYLTTVVPAAALIFWYRSCYLDWFRTGRWAFTVLLSFFLGASLVFLFLSGPQATQYKSRILASVALGVFSAGALRIVYDRAPRICLLILSAFFVPLASGVEFAAGTDWKPTDPWLEKGWQLVHADPGQQALHDWILRQTSVRDVFIDSYLTVPVFARRALYCGVDIRRNRVSGPRPHDGFGFPPAVWLAEVFGHPQAELAERSAIVDHLYSTTAMPLENGVLEILRKQAGDADLYVIARDASTRARLSADPRFASAFRNEAAAVFKLGRGR